jgi:hypothetical protein
VSGKTYIAKQQQQENFSGASNFHLNINQYFVRRENEQNFHFYLVTINGFIGA